MTKAKTKRKTSKSNNLEVKVKLLDNRAEVPKYMTEGDAGMDLVATSFMTKHGFIEYGTGVSIEIPKGYVGLVFPRSSISTRGLDLCNSVGVIDSGYRGEIRCRFNTVSTNYKRYEEGERIAQLVIMPYPQVKFKLVEELTETKRDTGGFGSTNG